MDFCFFCFYFFFSFFFHLKFDKTTPFQSSIAIAGFDKRFIHQQKLSSLMILWLMSLIFYDGILVKRAPYCVDFLSIFHSMCQLYISNFSQSYLFAGCCFFLSFFAITYNSIVKT